jgi:multiple sugar transport system substrate-binding protein
MVKSLKWVAFLLLALGFGAFVLSQKPPSQRKYPDRIEVRFWHRWGGEWAKVVGNIAERYNQSQTKYEVVALSVPNSGADAKLTLGIIGGNPPDVMSMWNGAIPSLASNGLLTPLEEVMSKEDQDRFMNESYPVIRDSGRFGEKTYGVTIGSDLSALYVNEDHLAELGLTADQFPKTLEGVCELGNRLNKTDANGNLTRLGFLLNSFSFVAYSFGPGFYDRAGTKLTLNSPDNLRALEFITEERRKIGFEKVTRFQAGLNTGSDTGGWPFITGDLSITIDGQWRVEEIRKYRPDMKYRVIPIPPPAKNGLAMGGTLSGNFMVIPTSAKQKQGAWDFIRFWSGFADKEASARCFNDGGWLPLFPDLVETKTFQAWLKQGPEFQGFIDILSSENCRPMPPVPYLQFLNDQIGRSEDIAVRGTLSPKAALEKLEFTVQEERRKRKSLGYEE